MLSYLIGEGLDIPTDTKLQILERGKLVYGALTIARTIDKNPQNQGSLIYKMHANSMRTCAPLTLIRGTKF